MQKEASKWFSEKKMALLQVFVLDRNKYAMNEIVCRDRSLKAGYTCYRTFKRDLEQSTANLGDINNG